MRSRKKYRLLLGASKKRKEMKMMLGLLTMGTIFVKIKVSKLKMEAKNRCVLMNDSHEQYYSSLSSYKQGLTISQKILENSMDFK